MQYFYDTCSLLNKGKEVFNQKEKFFISSITLKELEGIKTSSTKDADIKYKARKIINLLASHEDQYDVVTYQKEWDDILKEKPVLSDNNDSRIIISALSVKTPIIFVTQDLCCKSIAKTVGLNVEYLQDDISDYTGYEVVKLSTDEELALFYDQIYNQNSMPIDLYENEYLFVKDASNKIIDKYKVIEGKLQQLKDFPTFDSSMFGKTKPKDDYQWAAMDSLLHNKITMLRGAAGTGKSYLAMSYLMSKLDKGDIDRIVIFCNTVATNGAAKLGSIMG